MADENQLGTIDALAQASFLIQATLERQAAEHGFSLIQTRLLGVLRDREPTINELSVLLGLDKSSVSGLVDRAERRGMVARRPSEIDRRSVQVGLTAEGRTIITAVAAGFETDVVALLSPLSASERRSLTGLLSRVLVQHAATYGIDLFATRG
jgi:DNA-binding MarR family transcriptional regulator